MKRLLAFFLLAAPLQAIQHHEALFRSLDPRSLSKQLAFYQLYPETPEGAKAQERAATLLGLDSTALLLTESSSLNSIIALFSGQGSGDLVLSKSMIQQINTAAFNFPNRKLKGFQAETLEELHLLPPEQIDVGRALLLSHTSQERSRYEALLDLMALQIKASVGPATDSLSLIKAINQFLFYEMGFRFPPHSKFSKEIDRYTFLPSVLDGRKGVCLGVSLLYLALAQRLNLPLEIITPPGHIYLRYREEELIVNIETTARGIDMPCWIYLGANTKALQERNLKETIGLAFVNEGSVYWGQEDYQGALKCYSRAEPFLENDPTLRMLQGFSHAILGNAKTAHDRLSPLRDQITDSEVSPDTIIADYLDGHAGGEALAAVFSQTDQQEASVIKKRKRLEKALEEYPLFRAGWFHLAACWMQQQRSREALEALEHAWKLGEQTATSAYLLASLHASRYHFDRAWNYLHAAEAITNAKDHHPRCLKELRRNLAASYAEPGEINENLHKNR